MAEKIKSAEDAVRIGQALRERRRYLGKALKDIELELDINCGQLSRFENGVFKTHSPNLHKYAKYLQISESEDSLGRRFDLFAARSPRHRKAAEEFLRVLETLF